jgi:hypothetical protein
VASEKALELGKKVVVICQKSKISDWVEHFKQYPSLEVDVINYDMVWRKKHYAEMADFTLILDESSLIKNPTAKRTKFIMKMKFQNIILLSGTVCSGKYEELWTQCHLLGWKISKKLFYDQYIITEKIDVGGFPIVVVRGYKNVERLKSKLREYGAVFMTYDEALSLSPELTSIPEMTEPILISVENTKEYRRFNRDRVIEIEGETLVGSTSLTKLLYLRQLASQYNKNKWSAFTELLESTGKRVIVFYNFKYEFEKLKSLITRPVSYINGDGVDLKNYNDYEDSVTLCQYQAGSKGHNLQKAHITIYFSLPLSYEDWSQSMARTRRIGQSKVCRYYVLMCNKSVEGEIYETLKQRKNYTDELFRQSSEGE